MELSKILKDPDYRILKKRKIAVILGGKSAEREISIISGTAVLAALGRLNLSAVAIDGADHLEEQLKEKKIDIAFIALHGRWGEDGTVQGLLEYLDIPYTGSGVHASALAMNKISSKQIFLQNKIPTAPFVTFNLLNNLELESKKVALRDFPVIVKPYNEGSSIGCHIAKNRAELLSIFNTEKKRYKRLFAEKFIKGKELSVGILEMFGKLEILPILELSPKRKFYDYKAKYTAGLTDFIIPAKIKESQSEKIKSIALKTHEALNCHGFSRVDFMLSEKTGEPFVLELNTIPGLTALSDIPAQARAAGITYDELIFHILVSSLTAGRSLKKAIYHG